MVFNIKLITRVALMTGCIFAACWSYFTTDFIVTPMMLGLFSTALLFELIWKIHKQHRTWNSFLIAIEHGDFSRQYKLQSEKDETDLTHAMDVILRRFEQLKQDQAAKEKLLNYVYENVPIGLFCLNEEGSHIFHNKASSTLLDIQRPGIKLITESWPELAELLNEGNAVNQELIKNNGKDYLVNIFPFSLQSDNFLLISLQDVNSILSIQELQSWQKLIRVMTHEIMNSATPILSLIKVINQRLITDGQWSGGGQNDPKKLVASLLAIEKRTAGLISFISNYKQVNREIEPQLSTINVDDMLIELEFTAAAYGEVVINADLAGKKEFSMDKNLMIQVLINMIKNAIEATASLTKPMVQLDVYIKKKYCVFAVSDNGPGIDQSILDQVFLPFYTTKVEGSGIGLALAKKIVHAHHGELLYKREDQRTIFQVRLPI